MTKTALFTNFTDKEFIGYWDGKPRKFLAGQSQYMPDYLAQHLAKHLVNRELLRTDSSGSLIYKNGEKMTSPKFPEQVPLFMELFNKAYISDETEEDNTPEPSALDTEIDVINKNKEVATSEKAQVVLPPDFEDDQDDEVNPPAGAEKSTAQ